MDPCGTSLVTADQSETIRNFGTSTFKEKTFHQANTLTRESICSKFGQQKVKWQAIERFAAV